MIQTFEGVPVYLRGEIAETDVTLADGRIAEIGGPAQGEVIDARGMNLADRGKIAPGQRADLVLVDWPKGAKPAILGTWVAGRCAYRGMPAG